MMMSASSEPRDLSPLPSPSIMAGCIPSFCRLAIVEPPSTIARAAVVDLGALAIAKSVVTVIAGLVADSAATGENTLVFADQPRRQRGRPKHGPSLVWPIR